MQADTWEGEFNGPASPSTVRENIEVRFLFYSIAGGLRDSEKDKKEALSEGKREKEKGDWRRGPDCMRNFLISLCRPLIWPVDLGMMKTLPTIACADFLN